MSGTGAFGLNTITFREMNALAANADFFGVSYGEQMANAGRVAAGQIMRSDLRRSTLVVCSTGYISGAGLAMARYLKEAGYPVQVILLESPGHIEDVPVREKLEALKVLDVPLIEADTPEKVQGADFEGADVIVDALSGAGPGEAGKVAISRINRSRAYKISLDMPGGYRQDAGERVEHVEPDEIIAFHSPKAGLEQYNASVVDIGIPQRAITYVGPGDLANMQIRGDVSHKGHSGGKVLVIGGGPYVGGPALAALAALRTGSDLVAIAAPQRAADIIASNSLDLVVWPLSNREVIVDEDIERLRYLIERHEVVVMGMGMGGDPRTMSAILKILPICKKMVIDASALIPGYPFTGIITPHHSEFKHISGMVPGPDPVQNAAMAREFSARQGVVTLLKGPVDVISDGSRVRMNCTGNPGMTVSGTGDVLSGIVGSLYCKNPAFEAACCGAFLSGLAGNMAFRDRGFGLTATGVIDMIPQALKKHHPGYRKTMESLSLLRYRL
jgi:NAD(P)H-hydrate epimerase